MKSSRRNAEDADDEDSVKDTMSVLIQKLLIENRNLKDENKLLRASHSQGEVKESFLEPVRFPVQQRSYAQVAADNQHYAETGFERKYGKGIKKKNLRACQFCGGIHRWGKDRCPAFGNKCQVCLKMNHLDKVCFYSKKVLKRRRSLPVSLDQRKNGDYDDTELNETPKLVVKTANKTEDINEDTKPADACNNEGVRDDTQDEQIIGKEKSYEFKVAKTADTAAKENFMGKKDKVLEWKEIMEKDKIQSKQSEIRSLKKAEKIMEDKAEKQSWLDIEDGTKFPLWAAYIKANPEMKVQFPEKGGCDVFSFQRKGDVMYSAYRK